MNQAREQRERIIKDSSIHMHEGHFHQHTVFDQETSLHSLRTYNAAQGRVLIDDETSRAVLLIETNDHWEV